MPVLDNAQLHRFELNVEGKTAFANYKLDGNTLYINYVESPVELRGTGVAGDLMKGIVSIARDKNYKIFPICSYAVSWLRRHDEYQDLLA